MYLPASQLEALLVRRLAPRLQAQVAAVSSKELRNGGTVLGLLQWDSGRLGIEGLASTDGGLLGLRGLYSFGGDADQLGSLGSRTSQRRTAAKKGSPLADGGYTEQERQEGQAQQGLPLTPTSTTALGGGTGERERIYGRFSTGAELYYGVFNRTGGMSLGARFATLPDHRGTPLTATLTLNPLIGTIAAGYAVCAGRRCSLATRLAFNVFSYESEWSAGVELWRKRLVRPVEEEDDQLEQGNLYGGPLIPALGRGASVLDLRDAVSSAQSMPNGASKSKRERSFRAKMEWRLDHDNDGGQPVSTEAPAAAPVSSTLLATTPPATEEQASLVATLADTTLNSQPPKMPTDDDDEEYTGVLKARLDQNLKIGLLWEGRVKSLIFSLGSDIDLRRADQPFRTLGLEVQFSS